jgi:hypothetical protein
MLFHKELEPVEDRDLLEYIDDCVTLCAGEFRRARESLPAPFRVVLGDQTQPEYRMVEGQAPLIILVSGTNERQLRFQAGHEVFHWLATPESAAPGIFHWTHEMLAWEISLHCLRSSQDRKGYGLMAHAATCEEWLENEAQRATLERMLTEPLVSGIPYDWVFGRAFVVGRKLQEVAGWDHVKQLATCFDEEGKPDVRGWIGALPPDLSEAVRRVLGEPASNWV